MASTLMLTYGLLIAVIAGLTGVWWTIIFPLPFILAWAWLGTRGVDNGLTNN